MLADLLADALEGLAAGAVRLVDLVVLVDARQVRRQRLAHRLAFGARRRARRLGLALGGPIFERGIEHDGIEEDGLGAALQRLAGRAEAPALEPCNLEVQGLISGLLKLQLALQASEKIVQLAQAYLVRLAYRSCSHPSLRA